MTQRLKVPPTKSVLLELKRRIGFLEQGHEMLEHKKELLTRLVYERLTQYRSLRHEIRPTLEAAYRALGITHMRMGARMLRQISVGLPPGIVVRILPRSSLGVEYPSVVAEPLPARPVGLMWTEAGFDQARTRLTELAVMLARLGEAEAALWRLVAEQRRTQKRVNALKYNVIPRYRTTIQFIESVLEEEERNTLFQIRLLKDRPHPTE